MRFIILRAVSFCDKSLYPSPSFGAALGSRCRFSSRARLLLRFDVFCLFAALCSGSWKARSREGWKDGSDQRYGFHWTSMLKCTNLFCSGRAISSVYVHCASFVAVSCPPAGRAPCPLSPSLCKPIGHDLTIHPDACGLLDDISPRACRYSELAREFSPVTVFVCSMSRRRARGRERMESRVGK